MTNQIRMVLTINYTEFTQSCEKEPGNGMISQMVRAFHEFHSASSEKIFQKIDFPFDLKPKFPDFLAKW